jgi:hypothetical protein
LAVRGARYDRVPDDTEREWATRLLQELLPGRLADPSPNLIELIRHAALDDSTTTGSGWVKTLGSCLVFRIRAGEHWCIYIYSTADV